ncbi:MAG TPA: M23 family metallopeptidase [Candidatus Absconditabacterales bacterium]|nr:M23 family metallopeptidase [Candidatus Absconditabacterales bacterium]
MTELETPIPERAEETTEGETGEATIATTKLQLAQTYLNFLDKQKGGILATSAGLGVNFNPLQKDAIDYLTTEKPIKDKGIFDKISKNIKKKFIERLSGGTFLEYDKASLNKMKALIIQYKDDQTKLQELMVQIQEGTDPTLVQENTKKSPEEQVVPVMVPEIVAEGNELPKPYLFPMPGNIVTSVKGPRWGKEHEGIDIGGTEKEIKSIANGSVEAVGFGSEKAGFNGYGNYVVVKLDTGDRVLYGHLEKLPSLKVDDLIQAGDIIGIMGDTGHSTGLHLHLEIRKGDKNDVTNFFSREVIDPLTVISVTKDMVSPAVLAHMNKTLLDEDSSAIA